MIRAAVFSDTHGNTEPMLQAALTCRADVLIHLGDHDRDALVLQVNALTDQLNFARTDDYVIRTARDELGMIMPGEVRYVNGAR